MIGVAEGEKLIAILTTVPKIFISYRREDSSGYAGRLNEKLSQVFGAKNVFMDLEDIEAGTDFDQAIRKSVSACDALIVLIGKRWLSVTDGSGERRLGDPHDYVHLEIATALDRDIRVIPVLLNRAEMPTQSDLPQAISKLALRQARELSDDRWDYDTERLIEALGGRPLMHRLKRSGLLKWGLGIACFVLVAVSLALYATRGVTRDAEKFLAALGDNDVATAYSLAATALKSRESADSLGVKLKQLGLNDYRSSSWSSRSIKNNTAALTGTVTTRQGGTIPITMNLLKEGGSWKVLAISGPQAGIRETELSEKANEASSKHFADLESTLKHLSLSADPTSVAATAFHVAEVGVHIAYIDPAVSEQYEVIGLKFPAGAVVWRVEAESPAQKSGLQAQDVIVQIDRDKLESENDLRNAIKKMQPEKTRFHVRRGARDLDVVGAWRAPPARK
ncbi:MAG: TIR domain-containing protein [Burkholderiales bacterium]